MSENFITGDELSGLISAQTGATSKKFKRRDFVEPLLEFCHDGNYTARLGIVYGLRSTGKTVGMLQAAEQLMSEGHRVAYARFNYEETGIGSANEEIIRLAKDGYTHLFIDEASYLGGFVNAVAEWADMFVPIYRLKIIISGTDSLMLATAENTSLFHRYVEFSTNWNSFPEYARITGNSFEEYRRSGGVFGVSDYKKFIQDAVVENLIHTIDHMMDGPHRKTILIDRLYGIEASVVYKAVISILKCALEVPVKEHFAEKANEKNIPDIGSAVAQLSHSEKRDIKEWIAETVTVYRKFTGVSDPVDTIEALIEFLIRIGCLSEYTAGTSEFAKPNTLIFNHNALMNFSVEETVQSISDSTGFDSAELSESIRQAGIGAMNESIVFAHLARGIERKSSIFEGDKIFKYRDTKDREIDTVIINRDAKILRLIEVKSKAKIDTARVKSGEVRHLFDDEVLKTIGVDGSFKITRAVVYGGKTDANPELLLINIEDLLAHYTDLSRYFDRLEQQAAQSKTPLHDELRTATEISKQYKDEHGDAPASKSKNRGYR